LVAPLDTLAASAAAQTTATVTKAAGPPDPARRQTLFAQYCAACHGVNGGGGQGPSLVHERERKNLAQIQQWIIDPTPPMPRLFPSTLTRADVRDVAAFVAQL
jgi:mono/diheme cytochrome c family protein